MTKDYIKEVYANLEKKLGKQPSEDEFFDNSNVTRHYLLQGGFRTFNQLVKEMGGTPKPFFHSGYSEAQCLISFGEMIRQLEPMRIPSAVDWIFNKGRPSVENFKKKFKVKTWSQIAEKFYDFAKNKDEWRDVIVLIPKTDTVPSLIEVKENEECFVYFMFDSKSRYYKIGISSMPEWREKTLQSEKPTIKLIAAKKYINRRIAANIEKALHDSYSHRRKRGEWFELDLEDIEEIKITLSQ